MDSCSVFTSLAVAGVIVGIYKMGFKKFSNEVFQCIVYYGFRAFQHLSMGSVLSKWSENSLQSPDLVILHRFPPAKTIPNMSGFVMKLETYMRMAGIKYIVDTTEPLGPKGKSPWISVNGHNFGDSQLILEYLRSHFSKDLNAKFTTEQKALAQVVRVTMEEHIFWGFSLWAFDQDPDRTICKKIDLPFYAYAFLSYNVKKIAWGHGIGRHSTPDIQHQLSNSIRAVATLIGDKPFLLGDEPCEEDAAIFGFFAQILWGLGSGSPYEEIVKEFPVIRKYGERMRAKFWQDWDECLAN